MQSSSTKLNRSLEITEQDSASLDKTGISPAFKRFTVAIELKQHFELNKICCNNQKCFKTWLCSVVLNN
jgi:hypothetical protein